VASLSDYLGPEMRANIDRVLGRGVEILGRFHHGLNGNWKLYMENVRTHTMPPCSIPFFQPSD